MGLRTLLRTSTTLVATTVVAALLTAPGASAATCLDCEDPELPDPGGNPCPTIAATTDPVIVSPTSPTKPVVGQTVSANTGVWNSNAKSLRSRWFVGGKPVGTTLSHTGTTKRVREYTVRPEDQDKTIRLWVRGVGASEVCVKDEYSNSTATVDLAPKPVNQSAPAISGNATVGQTLSATPGTWTNSPERFGFEWFREGTVAAVGHGQSYTPTAADLGKRLRVGVTAERLGHWSGFAYSALTPAIAPGTLVPTTPPSISGTSVYGATLIGNDGQWPADTTVTARRWERDGQPILGATGKTYTLGLDDVGHKVSFVVTADRTGYTSRTASAAGSTVARAAAPTWTGKRLSLKGTDKVTKKIKVAMGAKQIRLRSAAPGARITYRWLRSGKAIKGSTKKAHVIKKADRTKKLKARITISRPGHKALVIVTKAVKVKDNGKKIR